MMLFLSGMPDETLYASDLIDVLKKKHDSNTFKSMVCVAHTGIYSWDVIVNLLKRTQRLIKKFLFLYIRYSILKPVNLGVYLRAFFLKD